MKKGIDKAAVVQAACSLVDGEGAEALTLGRVAEALAIRTPSLYNHVRSLADLKREVAIVAMEQLNDELSASMVGKAGPDALRAGMGAFRGFVLAHPGRWQTLCGLPGREIESDATLKRASERLIRTLAAGLESYQLPPSETIHAIRSLRSFVHGFTTLELAGGFGMPIDINESFHWQVETFLVGLAGRCGAEPRSGGSGITKSPG